MTTIPTKKKMKTPLRVCSKNYQFSLSMRNLWNFLTFLSLCTLYSTIKDLYHFSSCSLPPIVSSYTSRRHRSVCYIKLLLHALLTCSTPLGTLLFLYGIIFRMMLSLFSSYVSIFSIAIVLIVKLLIYTKIPHLIG